MIRSRDTSAKPSRRGSKSSSSKAAASEGLRRNIPTRPTPNCQNSSFSLKGYVKGLNDARTMHGKRRVLARRVGG